MCPTIPTCAWAARSGLLRTIVCSVSPSQAWRTIGESVLPSRESTLSTCANSCSSTSLRLSAGAPPSVSSSGSRTCAINPSPELRPLATAGHEPRVGLGEHSPRVPTSFPSAPWPKVPPACRTRSDNDGRPRPGSARRGRTPCQIRPGTATTAPPSGLRSGARCVARTRPPARVAQRPQSLLASGSCCPLAGSPVGALLAKRDSELLFEHRDLVTQALVLLQQRPLAM